jgi:hypothetical protein
MQEDYGRRSVRNLMPPHLCNRIEGVGVVSGLSVTQVRPDLNETRSAIRQNIPGEETVLFVADIFRGGLLLCGSRGNDACIVGSAHRGK